MVAFTLLCNVAVALLTSIHSHNVGFHTLGTCATWIGGLREAAYVAVYIEARN